MIWVPILNRAASAGGAPVWDAGESVALNVIESEYCGEAGEKPKVGAAAALFTVCVNPGDVLGAKLLFGSLNEAVIERVPAFTAVVVNDALPLVTLTGEPRGVVFPLASPS